MTYDTLAAELGVDATVERRDGLAVILVSDCAPFADRDVRARLLALAAEQGITHLALELEDDAGHAPSLPRG